jgi:hypothetical protein
VNAIEKTLLLLFEVVVYIPQLPGNYVNRFEGGYIEFRLGLLSKIYLLLGQRVLQSLLNKAV